MRELNQAVLLELQYFPCQAWMAQLLRPEGIAIEQYEHYQKRSFRNRCHIAGSTGALGLTIPLAKGKNQQQPIREVVIAYDTPWQKQHWSSITTAYGRAPFFQDYAYLLEPFFRNQTRFLFDFNLALLEQCLAMTGIPGHYTLSAAYKMVENGGFLDQTGVMRPRDFAGELSGLFCQPRYPQVFEDKHGFIPGLSILDLLFCTGPETRYYLETGLSTGSQAVQV